MAISRFDTPADYKPINTYVPLPYQEIALGLQQKQKQFDDQVQKGELAKKLAESFQDLDNIAIGYDDKTNTFIERRAEMAGTNAAFKKSVQDKLDYFEGKNINDDPTIRKEYNSWLNDVKSYSTTGTRITEAKKKYDKIATNYAQNKALGKDLGGGTGENWFTQNEKLLKGDASKVDLSSLDQEYSPLGHIDVNENVMKIAGAIKANAVGAGFYGKDGFTKIKTELKQLDYKSDGKGNYNVDNSDKGRIFTALHSYLYTPHNEFDNAVQRSYDNLVRTGQLNSEVTSAQYKEAKRDEYLHRAVNTYSNIDRSSDVNINTALMDKAEEKAQQEVLSETFLTEKYDQANEGKSPLDGLEFDESGQLKVPTKSEFGLDTKGKISDNPMLAISRNTFTVKKDSEKYKEQKSKLEEVIKNNPGFENKTPKEAAEIYNAAVKNNSQISTPYKEVRGAANKHYTEQIFKGDLNTRGISLIMSKDGSSKTQGLSQISKTLGLDEKELRSQMKESRVNGIMNGEKPGMFTATVLDGGGNKVTLGITPSNEQSKHFTRSWAAGKLQRENKVGVNPFQDPVDGKWYIAQTFIDPNTQQFKTIVVDAKKDKEGVEIAPNANAYDENALFDQDDVRWKNAKYYPKNKEVKSPVVYSNSDDDLE